LLWQASSTAEHAGTTAQTVRITHPFHPLCGHEIELISRRQYWGEDRLVFKNQNGRLCTVSIRDHPIAPRSPWQNACVERLIGSIRRECLDHMIVFGEAHLRRILRGYAAYYNVSRTHRSLNKDAPLHRAIERLGAVISRPVLGGLHHQYCRI
jgi:hypothetical protein